MDLGALGDEVSHHDEDLTSGVDVEHTGADLATVLNDVRAVLGDDQRAGPLGPEALDDVGILPAAGRAEGNTSALQLLEERQRAPGGISSSIVLSRSVTISLTSGAAESGLPGNEYFCTVPFRVRRAWSG